MWTARRMAPAGGHGVACDFLGRTLLPVLYLAPPAVGARTSEEVLDSSMDCDHGGRRAGWKGKYNREAWGTELERLAGEGRALRICGGPSVLGVLGN